MILCVVVQREKRQLLAGRVKNASSGNHREKDWGKFRLEVLFVHVIVMVILHSHRDARHPAAVKSPFLSGTKDG